jgi:hypothetical protein
MRIMMGRMSSFSPTRSAMSLALIMVAMFLVWQA